MLPSSRGTRVVSTFKKQDKISEESQIATMSSVSFAQLKAIRLYLTAGCFLENVSAAANLTPQGVSNSSSTSSEPSSRSDKSSDSSLSSEDILFDATYEPPSGSKERTSTIISTSPYKKGLKRKREMDQKSE
ncbi:hypothetical protein HHI36_016493 [Cryptolaemus montrouzieri]|uniref:Uncharacterized protein n=1 Tax=Cryptolaemus montrouzieri TaxID=559131 RepID=A0ABD2NKP0_9CUCU